MSKSYRVPAAALEVTTEVKKSRFIARVAHVTDRQQAMEALSKAKRDYPDARHHCWAYLIGNPNSASSAAMNDDGEPSGTAGRPILNVIQHKTVGDIMLIVIRYFGGIKLGAGGLTRAYSSASEAVMSQLPISQQLAMYSVTLSCHYAQEQPLRHWASQHQAEITTPRYEDQVKISIKLPETHCAALQDWCQAHGIIWPERQH